MYSAQIELSIHAKISINYEQSLFLEQVTFTNGYLAMFCIVLALPTTPPPPGNAINPGGRSGSDGSNLGAIAGGATVIIIIIVTVGAVALTIFITFM